MGIVQQDEKETKVFARAVPVWYAGDDRPNLKRYREETRVACFEHPGMNKGELSVCMTYAKTLEQNMLHQGVSELFDCYTFPSVELSVHVRYPTQASPLLCFASSRMQEIEASRPNVTFGQMLLSFLVLHSNNYFVVYLGHFFFSSSLVALSGSGCRLPFRTMSTRCSW